jgi:Novel STAND NTPase 1
VTMRSEFLGHCAGFSGLVEAFNRSQYLVPALTRDQRQDAVERPLKLFGVTATPALVQRVLNDAGDDPDQLPVLQHVLVRSYRAWERAGSTGPLDLAHYSAVGGIEEALDRHGNEIVDGFTSDERIVTERLFRSLSVAQGGVAVRRPRRLGQLYDIAAATTADARERIDRIVTAFADRQNSFLTLSSPMLRRDTVVDITHESLIRKWKALAVWVRAETRSAEWYADLSRDVTRFHAREAGPWQDPELAAVLSRRAEDGWNESWANQYRRDGSPIFGDVISFLDESTRQQDERRRAEEEVLERERRQAAALARARRRSLIVAALLVVGAIAVSVLTYRLVQAARREAASQQRLAELTDTNRQAESAAAAIRDQLDRLAAAPRTATSDEQQKKNAQEIEQLRQNLERAQAQSKLSQDAIDKLRQDQELTTTDRGGLLRRIETLQQQLTQSTGEREALQTRVDTLQKQQDTLQKQQLGQSADDRQTLQRQVDEERSKLASLTDVAKALETENADLRKTIGSSAPSAATGDYREAFRQGVRAYDLRDWKASVQYMRDAIRFQSNVKEPLKRIPIYGLRLENYAPQSYLGAALFEAKDCAGMLDALKQAEAESPPGAVKSKLQAARVQCVGQK